MTFVREARLSEEGTMANEVVLKFDEKRRHGWTRKDCRLPKKSRHIVIRAYLLVRLESSPPRKSGWDQIGVNNWSEN